MEQFFLANFGRGDGNNQECSAPNQRQWIVLWSWRCYFYYSLTQLFYFVTSRFLPWPIILCLYHIFTESMFDFFSKLCLCSFYSFHVS
ncbi:hypothetical protein AMTRI_Chr10g228580 [Amborella trichopoda]